MMNFITQHMTALEAVASLGIGLVAGVKLPALAERAVAKVTGRSMDLTSGWRGPLAGAALTAALGFSLYSMKFVNYQTASTIALAGVTVGALNLANSYLNLPLPGVALIDGSAGLMGFGSYLGNMDEPEFGNYHMATSGMHAGMHATGDMFGLAGKDINLF